MKSTAQIINRIFGFRPIVIAALCVVVLSAIAALHSNTDDVVAPTEVSAKVLTAHQPTATSSRSSVATGTSIPSFPHAVRLDLERPSTGDRVITRRVQLCQFREPTVDVVRGQVAARYEPQWNASRQIPWQVFGHGEFIGPHRTQSVDVYYLRPNDQLELVYRFTHKANATPYRLSAGDEIMIESLTAPELNKGDLVQGRGLKIQSDGTITLPLIGQVPVAGRTVDEIRLDLDERYLRYYTDPAITVTPLKTNTKLEGLRESVDGRYGQGGLVRQATVSPEGTIQLPAIQSVPAHGLTLSELQKEIEERYLERIGAGVEVTVVLVNRAPSFVYVLGEVPNPGQYQLRKPTSVMQALSMAGGWNNGGDLREIVIFRRTDDWQLMATKLDLRAALHGNCLLPADEIWIRDSDVVLVPKSKVLLIDDFIDLVFTRGIYGIIPVGVSVNLSKLSTI